jgi:dipeptidyl aminopeptidase/acylaminoacyl peptidase
MRHLISILFGVLALVVLAVGLAWLLEPRGALPSQQQVSSLRTPPPGLAETPTPEEFVLITPPVVPSPPPTSTPHPWPVGTPLPIPGPAKDPSGTILYIAISGSEPSSHRQCTVRALQVDETGQLLGEAREIANIENCGEMKASPDGQYLAIPQACGDTGRHPIIFDLKTLQMWPTFGSNCAASGRLYGWHPDSKHILFGADAFSLEFQFVDGQSWRDAGLWLVDIQTNEYSVLAGNVLPNGGSAVSPDGSCVVYVDDGETWLVSLDGTQRKQLDAPISYLCGWSPDGNQIFYTTGGGVGITNVLDGRHTQLDPDVDGRQERSPTPLPETILAVWSPDGRTVAVTQVMIPQETRDDFDPFKEGDIYLIDASGNRKWPLLLEGNGLSPAWSPDGSMLAFLSNNSGSPQIWVVNVDGTGLRQLTHEEPASRLPAYYAPVWIPSTEAKF